MPDCIEVFAFNVRFGDAILVRFPDRDDAGGRVLRHLLIDVGNTLTAAKPKNRSMPGEPGGADDVLPPAVDEILKVLDGHTLDLYVMSHEHLDHVQGLPYAQSRRAAGATSLRDVLQPRFVWMTASAEGEAYYKRHKKAHLENEKRKAAITAIQAHLWASGGSALVSLAPMLLNNNPVHTGPCVEWLKKLVPDGETPRYLHRNVSTADLSTAHPFRDAQVEIWAPEEDTSEYYGRFKPMALGAAAPGVGHGPVERKDLHLVPPPGVDASAFLNLVDMRRRGILENLLAIDKAANNTSLVFCLSWRGVRLLFPGDAEERSWKTMKRAGVLKPVDFLKVSHHGSENGTPDPEILDLVLPVDDPPAVKARRVALVSTWRDTYDGIPNDPTTLKLTERCARLVSTIDEPTKPYVKVELPARD